MKLNCAKVSYEELDRNCSLDTIWMEGDSDHDIGGLNISLDCAGVASNAICLDWDSFGAEPQAFSESERPVDTVLGGFLLSVGGNNASIDETLSDDVPAVLRSYLQEANLEYKLQPGSSAGVLWYALYTDFVNGVVYDEDISQTAFRNRQSSIITIGDINNQSPPADYGEETGSHQYWFEGPPMSFFEAAVIMVHEASHGIYPGHGPCDCDRDADGAYGAGGWWGFQWILENRETFSTSECFDYINELYDRSCVRISEADKWSVCDYEFLIALCSEPTI